MTQGIILTTPTSYSVNLNNTFGVLSFLNGGTGLSTLGTSNQILGVNASASGYEFKSISVSSALAINNTPGTITLSLATDPTIPGNSGVTIPSGTTAQRPSSPNIGQLRFNTTLGFNEYWTGTSWQQVIDTQVSSDMFQPSGFANRADSTVTFDASTQTVTISPTGTTYDLYIGGQRFVKTSESIVLPNTYGSYLVYFDTTATLQFEALSLGTTTYEYSSNISVATIIYTPTVSSVSDQRHGISMPWASIQYHVNTTGIAFVSGLDPIGYTLNGTGNTDVEAQISLTDGVLYYADININVTNATTPSTPYQQVLNGPLTIPLIYPFGSGNGSLVTTQPTVFPVLQGTNLIQYASFNGTDWVTQEATDGYYVGTWIFATSSYPYPIAGAIGIHQSATPQLAIQDNNFDDLQQIFGTSLIGLRPLYLLIFQTSTSFTNTPHATLVDIIDYRTASVTAPLDHSALSGLADDDHLQYVANDYPRIITAEHTFAPTVQQPPFSLGPNAQGQLVTGFNADYLNGNHASAFQLINSNLTSLSETNTNGLYVITGSGTSSTVSLTSSDGTLTLTNANGTGGNINVDLTPVGTAVNGAFAKITTNAYGQITSTSNIQSTDIITTLGYTPLSLAGGTMAGSINMSNNSIINLASPVNPNDAATKQYVDGISTGLIWQHPIVTGSYLGDTSTPPSGTPALGDTYLIDTGGNTGAWSSFAVGDLVTWDNTSSWKLIKSSAIGDRYGVNFDGDPTTSLVGSAINNSENVVTISGGTAGAWTYTFASPLNNWAAYVNNTNDIFYGDTYVYSSSLSQWVLFSSAAPVTAGDGLYYSGNTINVGTASASRIVVNTTNIDLATTGVIAGTYEKVTVDTYGRITTGTSLDITDITTALGYTPQPTDANLTALFNTATTGLYAITGSGTSVTRQIIVPTGLSITNADGVNGNPTLSLTTNLLGIENITAPGIVSYAGANTFNSISLVAPSSGITITNANGVGGNPTFALTGNLASLENLSSNGLVVQYSAGSLISRTITGTAGTISVTNGNGISGNPVISIDPNYIGQSSITTVGTVTSGAWNGTPVGVLYGGTGLSTAPTDGQLLIGSSTGNDYVLSTLTAGSGIVITNGNGTITISTTGVGNVTGTTNEIVVTTTTNNAAVSIYPNPIIPGNNSITVPSGTTAQRPATPTDGMVRNNTTEEILEGYSNPYGIYVSPTSLQRTMLYRKRRWLVDEFITGQGNPQGSYWFFGGQNTYGDLAWTIPNTFSGGNNAIITGIQDHPGILQFTVNNGPNNITCMVLAAGTNNTTTTEFILANQVEYFAFLWQIPPTSPVNQMGFQYGLAQDISQLTTGGTDSVLFTYNSAASPSLQFITRGSNVSAPAINTITVANGTWYLCEAFYDGTSWTPVVNGITYAAQTTNIPTAAVNVGVLANNLGAPTPLSFNIDYFAFMTREMGNRYP
jgi:hypothetical protein